MNRVIQIKNLQESEDTYVGQLILAGEKYTIQDEIERNRFASDQKVNQHIWSSPAKIEIWDGELALSASDGDKWLKLIDDHASDIDNRSIVHATPRYLGSYTYFTGADDDHTDPYKTGGSSNVEDLFFDHVSGVSENPMVKYLDFNTIKNKSYVRQGDLMWENCRFDFLNLEIVPRVTVGEVVSGGAGYDLYGGYLVIPAAVSGNGHFDIEDENRVLVQMVQNEFGDCPAGFWDATWDENEKEFVDIVPNPYGTGAYNMFAVEVQLHRFLNRRRLLGTNRKDCETEDVAQLGHNMRIKTSAYTHGQDHDWSVVATLMLYRKYTV